MAVVSRSPFEYYPSVAPTGGGIAAAFQQGQAAAEQLERERATTERTRALLPFEMQQFGTLDAMRRQQMELNRAAEGRTAADYARLGAAFDGAAPVGAPPTATVRPSGAGLIPPAEAQAVRTRLAPAWQGLEQTYNLPAGYLDQTARIESGYSPTAQRAGSRYVGMFQIGPEAAADLGLPLDARTDPLRSSEAAAQFAARNAQALRRTLGRPPQGWELYLAHQQGAGGASALLANPQRSALDALATAYGGDRNRAAAAITGNGGTLDMTAGQFAGLWQRKFGGGPATAQAAPGAAPAPTPGLAIPALPSGALGEGFVTQSTGGVPMTRPDLPAPGAGESQFMVPGPGGMTPVGAPLDAQGRPAVDMGVRFMSRPVEQGAAVQRALPTVELGPAVQQALGVPTSTPVAPQGDAATAPSSFAASAPLPAGLSPAMAGGTQLPGAISPAPMAAQPQGLSTPRPAAPAAAPGGAFTGGAPTGGEPVVPALIEPVAIARERAVLEQQRQALLTQRRVAIASRNAQLLAAADTALTQLGSEDIRLGGMEALTRFRQGDPAAIANYFSAMTNGAMRLQQNQDGTYNVFNGNQLAARNMSPQTLETYFRASFDTNTIAQVQRLREQQATRQAELDKSNLRITEKLYEIRAELIKAKSLEQHKADLRKVDPKITIQDNKVYIFDPERGRLQIGSVVTTDRTDPRKQLPKGQSRIELLETQTGAVPTQ